VAIIGVLTGLVALAAKKKTLMNLKRILGENIFRVLQKGSKHTIAPT